MTSELRECGFDVDGDWFRYRAGAVILDRGRVLMARNEVDPYHYSIGGGVRHGETAEDAVRREVLEETGVAMEIDRLVFVHQNFFAGSGGLAGRRCHEVALYFLMRYDSTPLGGDSTTLDSAREWHEWVELDRYGLDRPAHPSFFATELRSLGDAPKLITTRE
ncbi:MAG: NUDIX domain-containing protein [Propionicimonas sp.]